MRASIPLIVSVRVPHLVARAFDWGCDGTGRSAEISRAVAVIAPTGRRARPATHQPMNRLRDEEDGEGRWPSRSAGFRAWGVVDVLLDVGDVGRLEVTSRPVLSPCRSRVFSNFCTVTGSQWPRVD